MSKQVTPDTLAAALHSLPIGITTHGEIKGPIAAAIYAALPDQPDALRLTVERDGSISRIAGGPLEAPLSTDVQTNDWRRALRELAADLVNDHRGIPYDVIDRIDALATSAAAGEGGEG